MSLIKWHFNTNTKPTKVALENLLKDFLDGNLVCKLYTGDFHLENHSTDNSLSSELPKILIFTHTPSLNYN